MNRRNTRKPDMELSLCSSCASHYYNNNHYWIERVNLHQYVYEECSICKSRYGYDYKIWDINKNRTIAKEVHYG